MARWVLLFTLALATAGAGAQSTTPTAAETSPTTTSAATPAPTSALQTGGTAEPPDPSNTTTTTPDPPTTNTTTPDPPTTNTTTPDPTNTTTTTPDPSNTTTTTPDPLNTTTTTPDPSTTTTPDPPTTNTTTPDPPTTNTTTPDPPTTTPTTEATTTTTTPDPPTTTTTTEATTTTTTPDPLTTTPTTEATTTTTTPDPPTTNTTTPDPPTTNTTTPDPPTTNTTTPDPPTTNTTTPDPPTTNTTTPDPPTTTPTTEATTTTTTPDPPTTEATTTTTTPDPPTTTPTTEATTTTTTPEPPTTNTTTPDPPTTNTTTPDPPPTTTTTTPNPPTTTTAPTTPPIDTTSAPTTPLDCDNGGQLQNGVCICPDNWTGETCSVENVCKSQTVGGFNFPETIIGWFAYSEEKCNGSAAGIPQASIRCSIQNGQPGFQPPPQVLQCGQTLSDIQQNLTNVADLEILASSAQILTSNTEQLTAENVTTAAQIANTLLLFPNASENVRVAAIATVSQLLGANASAISDQNNATLDLTQTLEQVSVTSPESQVVQPNLVVQSAQIPAVDTQGVQFTALSGISGNFTPSRVQLNTNTSAVEVENGFAADALILVQFPAGAARSRQAAPNVSVGFVLYQNDRFFRSRQYHSERVTVRVLSATVSRDEGSVQPPRVEMAFKPTEINGVMMQDFACVFWDYNLDDWSTVGCEKGNASDGLLRCSCNHTTNFAALWSFRQTYRYANALNWISIVGLVVSVVGLVVTIIHHVSENVYRGSRDNNKSMKLTQLYIYISLLAFIITYLSGAENHSRMADIPTNINLSNTIPKSEQYVMPDQGSCTAVAALLHFFLLATFMWTSIYGTELVLLLRPMHRTLPPNWTTGSLAVGWGVPVVVMVITLAATYRVEDPLRYRQEEFCWLAGVDQNKHFDFAKPMFWGFILPLGLILLYNMALLIQVSMITCRTDPNLNSTNNLSFKKKFLISFSLCIILGLSWILGYLVLVMSGIANLVFSIIFCLCTTTQGFLIFLLFTARKPTFKSAVSRSAHYVSSFSRKFSGTSYDLHRNSETSISMGSYKDLKERQESEA